MPCFHLSFFFSEWKLPRYRTETAADSLHEAPDPRTREGVPLQSLLDETEADRDRSRTLFVRETDQNLVPEQTNEMEERQ